MDQGSEGKKTVVHVTIACDLFKALRGSRLSNREICETTGMHHNTVKRWLDELVVQGLVVKSPGDMHGKNGRAPALYTLAPAWGGQL